MGDPASKTRIHLTSKYRFKIVDVVESLTYRMSMPTIVGLCKRLPTCKFHCSSQNSLPGRDYETKSGFAVCVRSDNNFRDSLGAVGDRPDLRNGKGPERRRRPQRR